MSAHPDFAYTRDQMKRSAEELGSFSLASGGRVVDSLRIAGILEKGAVAGAAGALDRARTAGRKLAERIAARTAEDPSEAEQRA